jgi:3D-(3,5/4)-trihydroxycyclohexane-1,2-dione acylhydrolase (decyclizing)
VSERLTVAQALVRFLSVHEIERDGERSRFFAGALGIFGHGNVAGIGQAFAQYPGALPRSLGSAGFGTIYRRSRDGTVALDAPDGAGPAGATEALSIDLAANAESLGATVLRAGDIDELRAALARARDLSGPVVIAVETDRYAGVPGDESWWDVPVAEVSEHPAVAAAREQYERDRGRQRSYLSRP